MQQSLPLHTHSHTQTHAHSSLLHSQFNLGVWWGPHLGSLRVLMANGADIVMSDQSSCLPSRQHISHSYRFSPLAQAEDLDAYFMFIYYPSRLSGPAHKAKKLKRWQSRPHTPGKSDFYLWMVTKWLFQSFETSFQLSCTANILPLGKKARREMKVSI